ncbi:MAG TPA: hypothetical protein VK783_06455 [Bacteroidia bacterium]|jgi:hypothetical protein|nr:hypothetical protein [Bacteroidia bacterium]
MKKTTLLFAGMVLATIGATAQTADEIINKYADAIGGKEKLAAIKNIYMEGSIDANGQKIPLKLWKVINKSFRTEYSFGGMTGYSIIRKDSGWNFQPFAGQTVPEPMTADQVKASQTQLNPEGEDLINYKQKGYKVTMQGKDDVDGTEAYKLEEVISDSLVQTYYIDLDSYYILRVHVKTTSNGKVEEANEDFSNYTKTPEGFVFPMDIEGGAGGGGGIKFTVIKVNTTMDDKLFKPSIPSSSPAAVPNK